MLKIYKTQEPGILIASMSNSLKAKPVTQYEVDFKTIQTFYNKVNAYEKATGNQFFLESKGVFKEENLEDIEYIIAQDNTMLELDTIVVNVLDEGILSVTTTDIMPEKYEKLYLLSKPIIAIQVHKRLAAYKIEKGKFQLDFSTLINVLDIAREATEDDFRFVKNKKYMIVGYETDSSPQKLYFVYKNNKIFQVSSTHDTSKNLAGVFHASNAKDFLVGLGLPVSGKLKASDLNKLKRSPNYLTIS